MTGRIDYTYRRIALTDLYVKDAVTDEMRPPTEQELVNRGLKLTAPDIYSCAEIFDSELVYNRAEDRMVRVYTPIDPLPGEILSAGDVRQRHRNLPPDVKPAVLRARVVRSSTGNAKELAEAGVAVQRDAFLENVGEVLVELSPEEEAARLAQNPDSDFEVLSVPMGDVVPDSDVIQQENLIPHVWAGERYDR